MTTMNVCEGPIVLSNVTGNSGSGNGGGSGSAPGTGTGGAPAAKYNGFYSSYSEESEW